MEAAPGHTPLNCLLMTGAQRPLRLATAHQVGLNRTLSLSEALLDLQASEDISFGMFRDSFLTPVGYFPAAVERPFRAFCKILFFSNASCPFLVCHSDGSLQGNAIDSNRGSAESDKGKSFHRKTHIHFALCFSAASWCFQRNNVGGAMWGHELFESVLGQIFWRRVFRE